MNCFSPLKLDKNLSFYFSVGRKKVNILILTNETAAFKTVFYEVIYDVPWHLFTMILFFFKD